MPVIFLFVLAAFGNRDYKSMIRGYTDYGESLAAAAFG